MTPEAGSYVALYGSHGGGWREECKRRLDAAGVAWHDPTDSRWRDITHDNGDRHQPLIDQLVAEEQEALLGAGCVIFHVAGAEEGGGEPPASLAARFELGLLAGRDPKVPTFVHVAPDALGRNYLWAAIRRAPHLVRCNSLEEAVRRAIQRMAVDSAQARTVPHTVRE